MLDIFPGAELIPDWDWSVPDWIRDRFIDVVSRKACTLEEICDLLELSNRDAIKYFKIMERDGLISRSLHDNMLFFHVSGKNS